MNTFVQTIQPQLEVEVRRCYDCARWYGFERHSPSDFKGCPHCAAKTIDRLTADTNRMSRAIAALRGALKRLGRRQA